MRLLRVAAAARGIANHPADCVAGRDRAKILPWLQGDVGNFPGRREHVIDGTVAIGIDLHRSEEHTSELQSLMRISYAVFCLKKKTLISHIHKTHSKEHK